jgi:endonuclease G
MTKNLALSSLLLFAALTANAGAQTLHVSHCLQACPTGTPASNELIIRHLFAVSINQQTRLADWVSYRILEGSIGVASLLPREWYDDDLMQFGFQSSDLDGEQTGVSQPNLENQQDSSYRINEFIINAGDRGRLVPMSSFANSSYWPDLNLLSVMSLMKPDMRLGSWARLDQAINHMVQASKDAYVLVGPIDETNTSANLENANNSNSPSAYFKIVANADGEMSVFVFDQELPLHVNYCAQLLDLESVEALSGLDFFPEASAWPLGSLNRQLGC